VSSPVSNVPCDDDSDGDNGGGQKSLDRLRVSGKPDVRGCGMGKLAYQLISFAVLLVLVSNHIDVDLLWFVSGLLQCVAAEGLEIVLGLTMAFSPKKCEEKGESRDGELLTLKDGLMVVVAVTEGQAVCAVCG
jgi:hypothetical protein